MSACRRSLTFAAVMGPPDQGRPAGGGEVPGGNTVEALFHARKMFGLEGWLLQQSYVVRKQG